MLAHPLLAVACAAGVVIVLAAWLVRCRHSPSAIRIAVLAALGTLLCVAPTIRIFGITSDLQGTRYVYLASAWWSIALGSALLEGWHTQTARVVAAAVAVGVTLAAATATRAHLEPWTAARRERDRVLRAVDRIAAIVPPGGGDGCDRQRATARMCFRNGLNEALATLGRSFEWVDETRASAGMPG